MGHVIIVGEVKPKKPKRKKAKEPPKFISLLKLISLCGLPRSITRKERSAVRMYELNKENRLLTVVSLYRKATWVRVGHVGFPGTSLTTRDIIFGRFVLPRSYPLNCVVKKPPLVRVTKLEGQLLFALLAEEMRR